MPTLPPSAPSAPAEATADPRADHPRPPDRGFGAVRGMGLAGIEERTALAGGSLELHAVPGKGTVVLATFPLESGRAEEAA